jgi:hypothetical protein
MKLLIERSADENMVKGFLGMGKEKIDRTFTIKLKLKDVSEEEKRLLELYTYITQSGDKERYIALPIFLFDEDRYQWLTKNKLLWGTRYVTVRGLIEGVSWASSDLFGAFVQIPEVVSEKLAEILNDIEAGRLWMEGGATEEVEIKPV